MTRGFAGRSRDYWMQGLRRQAAREVPNGYPRFGYMLDNDGMPVGVLLLLYTSRINGGETTIQCNLSSWYVEPAFRNYAPLLTKIAQTEQGSHLPQYQSGDLDLADHRGPGIHLLLQRVVLLDTGAVARHLGHDGRDHLARSTRTIEGLSDG